MNKSILSESDLTELRKKLPHGAITEIAEKLKVTRTYVSLRLNNANTDNEKVVAEALSIIRRREELRNEVKKAIKKH